MKLKPVHLAACVLLAGGTVLGAAVHRDADPGESPSLVAGSSTRLAPAFSTYLGGTGGDSGSAIAVDSEGYVYVAGQTASSDFPTRGSIQSYRGSLLFPFADIFVAKFTPNGESLVYSTYLGGTGHEFVTALAVDASGRAYVAGGTTSPDFPTVDPVHGYRGGPILGSDGFVVRLSTDGNELEFATYLGGTGNDAVTALTLGTDGSVFLAGPTSSRDFPVTNDASQRAHAGGSLLLSDAFIAKLSQSNGGLTLEYATYLGGRMDDVPTALAVDALGRAYVTGFTNSPDFPVRDAMQSAFAGPMQDGAGDAFLSRLSADGRELEFSTYFGGKDDDQATALAIGSDGALFVTGWTLSDDFPASPQALQAVRGGGLDAFVARFDVSGTSPSMGFATYLGGSGDDAAHGISVGADNGVVISGATDGLGFPLVQPTQPFSAGAIDAFVAKLNAAGDALEHATYFGGTGVESLVRPALGTEGSICISGTTLSDDLPTLNPFQSQSAGDAARGNVFVACLAPGASPVAADEAEDVPVESALAANYPNPFNPTTTIPFAVARTGRVVLEVFDLIGRRVATVVDGEYAAGRHEARFDARGLASGIYVYRIQTKGFREARTMVLLR